MKNPFTIHHSLSFRRTAEPSRLILRLFALSRFTGAAFTLAEVLITLGIIGVVASITIPTLMQNIQDNELQTKMKKEYSILSQAEEQLSTDAGGKFADAVSGCCDGCQDCFRDVLKKKLSYIKECNRANGAALYPCLASDTVKMLNGGSTSGFYTYTAYWGGSGLVLKDGASLATYFGSSSTCTTSNACAWIILDVNGVQKPNTWGRDIYVFYMYSDTVRPSIAGKTNGFVSSDDCNTGLNYGLTCSSKYLTGN